MSGRNERRWDEYSYSCARCGRKVHDQLHVFQCEKCLVPLCNDDYYFGFCKDHFDTLSREDQELMKEASERSPSRFREQARAILGKYHSRQERKPWERPLVKKEAPALELTSEIRAPNRIRELDGRDALPDGIYERCSSCGVTLSTRQARYCKECLVVICKHCFKGGVLCPPHFARLPSDVQSQLEHDARSRHAFTTISVVATVAFFVWLLGGFWGAKRGGPIPPHLPATMFLALGSLGIGLLSAVIADKRTRNAILALKRQGIRVQYADREGARYVCEACGDKTPALTGGRAPQPYKCKICSKILCTNCYKEPGFCPSHDASISIEDRLVFVKIRRHERMMLTLLVIDGCFAISSLPLGAFTGIWALMYTGLVSFLAMIPLTFVAAAWLSAMEKRAGKKYRLGKEVRS
nr:hypothetical protein [Candidatus Sigynarchaeum springense]